jgi:hypothetical protein
MKYTAHPERKTAFTKEVEKDGRIHALIPKGSPWRNGIIERSNRTDNDECSHQIRFASLEAQREFLWVQIKLPQVKKDSAAKAEPTLEFACFGFQLLNATVETFG